MDVYGLDICIRACRVIEQRAVTAKQRADARFERETIEEILRAKLHQPLKRPRRRPLEERA
jgi:hypothetical protein